MKRIASVIVCALSVLACNGIVINDSAGQEVTGAAGAANVTVDDGQDDSLDAGQPKTEPVKTVQGTGGQAMISSTGGSVSATGGSQSTGGSVINAATGGNPPAGTAGTDAGDDGNVEAGGSAGETGYARLILWLADDTPQTHVVTSGTEELFTKYNLRNPGMRDTYIDIMLIGNSSWGPGPDGTDADFSEIRITDCGNKWEDRVAACAKPETCHFKDDYSGEVTPLYRGFSAQDDRLRVPHGETVQVCLYGRLAEVETSAASAGTTERLPRSGDIPNLRILSMITSDCDIVDALPPFTPPAMVLRKAAPVITWEPITEPLHVGVNIIAKLTVSNSSDVNPLAFQQLVFNIASGGDLEYEAIPDPLNTNYNPFDVFAFWLNDNVSPTSTLVPSSQPNYGVFTLRDGDHLVTGAIPMHIEARVNVTSAPSGSWIETKLEKTQLDSYEGFVYLTGPAGPGAMQSRKSTGDSTELESSVLWSDLSAGTEHVPYASTGNSSSDYLTSYLVDGIDGSAKITAP